MTINQQPAQTELSTSSVSLKVSCVTGRGIYRDYWRHLDCYEQSHQELSTRPSKLRQWRSSAATGSQFVARINPDVIPAMFSDQRGISSASEAEIARSLSRVEALDASILMLHTPSSIRPSAEHERAVTTLRARLPEALPLAWRADGLWEDSEQYFDLCAAHKIIPVIDPLMWDEEQPLPHGRHAYWKIMGGQGLTPRLGEYDLDKLLDLSDMWQSLAEELTDESMSQPEPTLWVNFTATQMFSAARRWRSTATR